MIVLSRIAIATLAIFSMPVLAQTQAQQDRLDEVARFVVTSPMCEKLGMQVDAELAAKAERTLGNETASWHVDPGVIDKLWDEAITRQVTILETDLDASVDAAKTDAQLRNIRQVLRRYGDICTAAASDPLFSRFVVRPPSYDLDKALIEVSDRMLQDGGLASWQTPAIQARGDLMMVAGTCRSKIGAARSDVLVKEYGQSDDPRIRGYYRKSFDHGLADPTIIDTLAGCDRAIQRLRLKANATSN